MAGAGDCAGISSANHLFALAGGPGAVAQDGLSAAGSSLLLMAALRIARCAQRQLRWGLFLFFPVFPCFFLFFPRMTAAVLLGLPGCLHMLGRLKNMPESYPSIDCLSAGRLRKTPPPLSLAVACRWRCARRLRRCGWRPAAATTPRPGACCWPPCSRWWTALAPRQRQPRPRRQVLPAGP